MLLSPASGAAPTNLAMINRILVCLDKSTYTDAATGFACWLGNHHAASLEGLVVLDVPGIERSVGAVPLGAMRFAKTSIATKEEEYHQLMERLLEAFKKRCDDSGVRHDEFEMQGTPANAILEEANYFDCVILGMRTFFAYGSGAGEDKVYGTDDDEPGDSLELVMDQSLAPVFAVPLGWSPAEGDFDVLIAFDGSQHAMRGLRQFAGLYRGTSARVTLLSCNEDAEASKCILAKAQAFLKAHGFEGIKTDSRAGDIRDSLTGEYAEPFDLIVLGAHSKSAVQEFFTGSLCKSLIERGDKPLLIANS
ncbi:MAG: hypothetical protein CMO74_12360 [Verrucomicrobiales bacterium]|nr:hypothetical protein [Verrucomicrobiales bacterium]|tara:strand:- start:1191 stop:2111 length:921 start_codon:yes stop_codon:yes gene_type:complete